MVAELTREEVQHVAALAYLRFSPAELDQLRSQLESILAHINQLQEIDTAAIPPTAQVIEVTSVLRDDVAGADRHECAFQALGVHDLDPPTRRRDAVISCLGATADRCRARQYPPRRRQLH